MKIQIPQENLQKIHNLFQKCGYESRIEGNFVKVKEKHFFGGFGKNYETCTEIRINKIKNALSFLKARV